MRSELIDPTVVETQKYRRFTDTSIAFVYTLTRATTERLPPSRNAVAPPTSFVPRSRR